MPTEKLLTALQWPTDRLSDKGKITWSRPGTEPDSTDVAMVLVTADKVHARLARFWPDGPDPIRMGVTWNISPGSEPVLKSFSYAGKSQPLDESLAIKRFAKTVQALASEPDFQTSGARWKEDPGSSWSM